MEPADPATEALAVGAGKGELDSAVAQRIYCFSLRVGEPITSPKHNSDGVVRALFVPTMQHGNQSRAA
jgi:hypothetical protein